MPKKNLVIFGYYFRQFYPNGMRVMWTSWPKNWEKSPTGKIVTVYID